MKTLLVENNGPELVRTNFWTDLDLGKIYVSLNARAFRVLLPRDLESALEEMWTAREVIITRGPWPEAKTKDGVELMFEDGSPAPFALHLDARAFDRLPAAQDNGRTDLQVIVYVGDRDGKPHEALRLPAKYRRAPRIPCMQPWKA
jgi:hypothetical protein